MKKISDARVKLLGIIDIAFGLIASLINLVDFIAALRLRDIPNPLIRVRYLIMLFISIALFIIGILIYKSKPSGRKKGLILAPVLIIAIILYGLWFTPHILGYLYLSICLVFFHLLVLSDFRVVEQFAEITKDKPGSEEVAEDIGIRDLIRASAVLFFIMGLENFFFSYLQSRPMGNTESQYRDFILGLSFTLVSIANFCLSSIKKKYVIKVIFSLFLIATVICLIMQMPLFILDVLTSGGFANKVTGLALFMHDSIISGFLIIILSRRIFKKINSMALFVVCGVLIIAAVIQVNTRFVQEGLQDDKNENYFRAALKSENQDACKKINDKFRRNDCYFALAEKMKNPDLCDKLIDNSDLGDAIYDHHSKKLCLALAKQDPSLCLSLKGVSRDACYEQVAQLKEDSSICDSIENRDFKCRCNYGIAKIQNNISICENQDDPWQRDCCLYDYARYKNAECVICERIQTEPFRKWCHETFTKCKSK